MKEAHIMSIVFSKAYMVTFPLSMYYYVRYDYNTMENTLLLNISVFKTKTMAGILKG